MNAKPNRETAVSSSRDSQPRRRRRIPIALRLVLGLALLIVIGAGLLMLPGVAANGRLSFMQAWFTAVSATTVTGLTVITASTDLTRPGQWLLLLLIQVGGVGYIFAASLTMRLLGRRLSILDRLALTSSLGLNTPAAIQQLLKRVFWGIFLIEGIGALLLFAHWGGSGIVPPQDAFFYAVFHAVSAFCNAGFDLFFGLSRYPDGLPGDTVSLAIMGALIVMGGLGIPVLSELFSWRRLRRFSLHTRITLVVVTALTLLGWIGLIIPEVRPGGVLANAPLSEQLAHTLFQSVSTRTAGFPGLSDFQQLSSETELVIIILMFIGSAPASMGGGITTGSFAVLMLGLWAYARGLPEAQLGGRSISLETVRRAGAILTVSVGVVIGATWLLLLTHDFSLEQALFEVVSAFATCGLSLGITTDLNLLGRLVIMGMMFWGRLGALTLVIALVQRRVAYQQLVSYPEEPVLIG